MHRASTTHTPPQRGPGRARSGTQLEAANLDECLLDPASGVEDAPVKENPSIGICWGALGAQRRFNVTGEEQARTGREPETLPGKCMGCGRDLVLGERYVCGPCLNAGHPDGSPSVEAVKDMYGHLDNWDEFIP